MARTFLTAVDLAKNELRSAVIQVLPTASAPESPVEGQIYFDSTLDRLRVYDGSAWVTMDPATVISYGTPGSSAVGDSAAAGSASTVARSDHTHGRESFGTPGSSAVGDSAAAGSASTVARSDHAHGRESFGTTASTQAIGDSAAGGSASTPSRSDHKHAMPAFGSSTAETSFGGSQANGSATTVARSDHAHGTPAHDASAHSAVKISDLAAPTSSVAFNGQSITGLADPTNAQDAATKAYVDAAAVGLDFKPSARAATTGNITLSGTQTVDGVSLSVGNRVLVKAQNTASENGLYEVKSGAWTRTTDADSNTEVTPGMFVFVEEGTTLADTGWVLATDGSITLGTTSLTFVQFNSSGASYLGGAGLTLDGSTFNVGAGTGISVGADTVSIDTSVVARKYATTIGDGSTTSYTVTHNLGTRDVIVQTYLAASTYDQVECDVLHATTNTVTIGFSVAPASDTIRVAVIG